MLPLCSILIPCEEEIVTKMRILIDAKIVVIKMDKLKLQKAHGSKLNCRKGTQRKARQENCFVEGILFYLCSTARQQQQPLRIFFFT